MNPDVLKNEIRQIEARHHSAVEACSEIFRFIRGILEQIEGPVDPEIKRVLRSELDRAYRRVA